jgi:hypothetical protein
MGFDPPPEDKLCPKIAITINGAKSQDGNGRVVVPLQLKPGL